jgi:methionine-gamma-lyase
MMSHGARTVGDRKLQAETLMLGYGYDPALSEGAIKCPVFQTSTFTFKRAEDGKRSFELAYGKRAPDAGEIPELIYSRINNPNLEILERRLAVWEDADHALVFASGAAAISSSILAFARPGSVIIHSNPLYGGTDHLFSQILPLFGIKAVGIDAPGRADQVAAAIGAARAIGELALVYLETPANPTSQLYDLSASAVSLASAYPDGQARPPLMVDNTLMGPLWQKPLACGADLSLYSLTKYFGGHSDVVAGGCVGDGRLISQIRGFRTIFGGMADPHSAWLLMRSLETLKLRMERSGDNARAVAVYLRSHPKVDQVQYLGLLPEGSEQRRIFDGQCTGAGATFSFTVKGGEAEAYRMLDALQVFKLAVSLGGTESLASHPATMTHTAVSAVAKAQYGISPDLVRLSIGIEDPDDLIADLARALDQI